VQAGELPTGPCCDMQECKGYTSPFRQLKAIMPPLAERQRVRLLKFKEVVEEVVSQ